MLWIIGIGLILIGGLWWYLIGRKHNPNLQSNVAGAVSNAASKVKDEADKLKGGK